MIRYAITDRLRLAGTEAERQAALVRQGERLARAGVDFLQVREKDLPVDQTVALAERVLEGVREVRGRTRVLLNVPGASTTRFVAPPRLGMHLSSAALKEWAVAGTSKITIPLELRSAACHSVEEALLACDFAGVLLFAPVFEKQVNGVPVRAGSGLRLLADVCRAVAPKPVLAMGGVTAGVIADCLAAGAAGIAGIRLFAEGGSDH